MEICKTGEDLLGETGLIKPDKDPGNEVSTRISNYGRPATAVLGLLLTASAVLWAPRPKKQKNME
ncbi:MAG: hypothetical protein OXI02_05985 [Candidatus Dadabacteria bacterium]|nr:hypothetical protein [Candidatus Dadabacteria bacterium]MDE0477593.1 hypothetical protein [Candidatus Dadabacteria bacterium]